MHGRKFGFFKYTSTRIHVNDIRICVFVSMSLFISMSVSAYLLVFLEFIGLSYTIIMLKRRSVSRYWYT